MNATTDPDKPKTLLGKFAIVTGGSKGLGADIALTLAQAGANIAILGRNLADLQTVKEKIEALGQQCWMVAADFEHPQEIEAAAKTLLAANPHWDILVNNAGIAKKMPLLETTVEDWDQIQNVNLRATFLLSTLIAPQMIKQKSGKIINISSIGTYYGTPGLAAYNASKAGINQLTKTMAIEWGSYNLQINAICPAIVLTDMGKQHWDSPQNQALGQKIKQRIPLQRFAEPQDVSELVLFLAGNGSDYINGAIIPLDNGARHCSF